MLFHLRFAEPAGEENSSPATARLIVEFGPRRHMRAAFRVVAVPLSNAGQITRRLSPADYERLLGSLGRITRCLCAQLTIDPR